VEEVTLRNCIEGLILRNGIEGLHCEGIASWKSHHQSHHGEENTALRLGVYGV